VREKVSRSHIQSCNHVCWEWTVGSLHTLTFQSHINFLNVKITRTNKHFTIDLFTLFSPFYQNNIFYRQPTPKEFHMNKKSTMRCVMVYTLSLWYIRVYIVPIERKNSHCEEFTTETKGKWLYQGVLYEAICKLRWKINKKNKKTYKQQRERVKKTFWRAKEMDEWYEHCSPFIFISFPFHSTQHVLTIYTAASPPEITYTFFIAFCYTSLHCKTCQLCGIDFSPALSYILLLFFYTHLVCQILLCCVSSRTKEKSFCTSYTRWCSLYRFLFSRFLRFHQKCYHICSLAVIMLFR